MRNSKDSNESRRKEKGLINLWTLLRLFRQLRYDNATWWYDKQKGLCTDFSSALPRMHQGGSAESNLSWEENICEFTRRSLRQLIENVCILCIFINCWVSDRQTSQYCVIASQITEIYHVFMLVSVRLRIESNYDYNFKREQTDRNRDRVNHEAIKILIYSTRSCSRLAAETVWYVTSCTMFFKMIKRAARRGVMIAGRSRCHRNNETVLLRRVCLFLISIGYQVTRHDYQIFLPKRESPCPRLRFYRRRA